MPKKVRKCRRCKTNDVVLGKKHCVYCLTIRRCIHCKIIKFKTEFDNNNKKCKECYEKERNNKALNYQLISYKDSRRNCRFCFKELKSIHALVQHEICCKQNPFSKKKSGKGGKNTKGHRGGNQFTTGHRKYTSQETKDKIRNSLKNRKRVACYHSKSSQDLFWNIYRQLPTDLQKYTKFAELNREKFFKREEKFMSVDFSCNNIFIIEFFGNMWHADPNKYKENDRPLPIKTLSHITAKEIWDRDAERKQFLEKQGYYVLEIWHDDYIKNKNAIIYNCIKKIIENENLRK